MILLGSAPGVAIIAQEEEYRIKAEFLERFTRFIEWPSDSSVSDTTVPFVICVIGKNPFGDYLEAIAKTRKIKEKPIVVHYVAKFEEITTCHLLFISRSERADLVRILSAAEERSILTVGDTEGFSQKGVHINFYQSGGNVRFEVNDTVVQKSKLKFSARLLKLARIIEPREK